MQRMFVMFLLYTSGCGQIAPNENSISNASLSDAVITHDLSSTIQKTTQVDTTDLFIDLPMYSDGESQIVETVDVQPQLETKSTFDSAGYDGAGAAGPTNWCSAKLSLPAIMCTPDYLTTHTKTLAPHIMIDTGKFTANSEQEAAFSEMSKKVVLVNLTTGLPISFTTSVTHIGYENPVSETHQLIATFTPDEPFPSDWIKLSIVGSVPPIFRLGLTCMEFKNESFGTLFHPESNPVIRSIQSCTKAVGKLKVLLMFSEQVEITIPDPTQVISILANGYPVACTNKAIPKPGEDDELSVLCDSWPKDAIVDISLNATLSTTNGVLLQPPPLMTGMSVTTKLQDSFFCQNCWHLPYVPFGTY